LTNVVDIEISNHQACAVDTFGGVWCWGTRFDDVRIAVPTRVQGLESTLQVSVGDYVTCALQNSGTVACWGGQGVFGVLGDGLLENSLAPVWVVGLTDADSIWSNDWRACATRATGAAVCWGSQYLGNDSVATAPTPVDVIDGTTDQPADDVWQIGGGYGYGCAVRFDDNLYCWGAAQAGSLGLTPDPTTETWTPTLPVAGLPPIDAIAAGPEHICALTLESTVYCWGRNADGQVGNGTIVDQLTPTFVYDPFA
jgi:alpha-tubulin suppressor-like RCC1 family protein